MYKHRVISKIHSLSIFWKRYQFRDQNEINKLMILNHAETQSTSVITTIIYHVLPPQVLI